jgi:hypothetical protein
MNKTLNKRKLNFSKLKTQNMINNNNHKIK